MNVFPASFSLIYIAIFLTAAALFAVTQRRRSNHVQFTGDSRAQGYQSH